MPHVRLRLVAQEVAAVAPSSVFELGCSVGVLRAELLRRLPKLRYHGCDFSQSAVDSIGDPNVVRVDLNKDPLPFADRTFDCIAGSGVFEYVKDLPRLFTELRRRLAPGGRLVATYFNMQHVYRKFVRVRGRQPFRNPTWLNDYSLAGFRDVLQSAGFAVRKEIPSNLGLGGSPSCGYERWSERPLRLLQHVPFVHHFAHQMVFVADAAGPRE